MAPQETLLIHRIRIFPSEKQGGQILSSSQDSDFSFGKTRRIHYVLLSRNL